jgi:transcriptional regulator with XRE-family HTH domain
MSQQDLAALVGVSRQWIVGLEQGRTRDIGLVLRTLARLGLALEIVEAGRGRPESGTVDLDRLLSRFGTPPDGF